MMKCVKETTIRETNGCCCGHHVLHLIKRYRPVYGEAHVEWLNRLYFDALSGVKSVRRLIYLSHKKYLKLRDDGLYSVLKRPNTVCNNFCRSLMMEVCDPSAFEEAFDIEMALHTLIELTTTNNRRKVISTGVTMLECTFAPTIITRYRQL